MAGDGRAIDYKQDQKGTTGDDLCLGGGGSMTVHLLNALQMDPVCCMSIIP